MRTRSSRRPWPSPTATGLAALALAPLAATAQGGAQGGAPCPDSVSVAACFELQVNRVASARSSNEAAELKAKPTGAPAIATAVPTSIADFLPRLAAALIAPGVNGDLDALGFAANLPLNDGVLLNGGGVLQVAVALHKPELFPALLEAVPDSRKAMVQTRQENTFDELDDVELKAAYNFERLTVGRGYRQHVAELSALAAAALSGRSRDSAFLALVRKQSGLSAAIRRNAAGVPVCSAVQTSRLRMDCLDPVYREGLEELIARGATEFVGEERAREGVLNDLGFDRVADLVNNQPQFNVAVIGRPRDRSVGPASVSLQVRGEMGLANLNGARRFCGGRLQPACFRTYVHQAAVQSSLRRADRFWLAVDLDRQAPYTAPFVASDSAHLTIPGRWTVAPSLGYGFYVGPGREGPQPARIDLAAEGRWARSDGIRPAQRYTASATYTQRLSDQLSATAALIWANKAEFLGTDVRRIRGTLGVRYKVNDERK